MSQTRKVAVIVGSLRKDSVSRKVAKAVAALTPNLRFEEVAIGDLPFYNQDDEADPPAVYRTFRDSIRAADAVLFVTPEYNRSIPAAVKNAVDVGSRPYGQAVWTGKPFAVISVSPGPLGGFGANHHLRQALAFFGAPLLPHEAYIGHAYGLFGEDGELIDESTAGFLHSFGETFAAWIEKTAPSAETA